MGYQIDMTGEVYWLLTVVEYFDNRRWLCKCVCGNTTIVARSDLRCGKVKSCGCRGIDLIGERFGKLTVLRRTDERNSEGRVLWECRCDCGNIVLKNSHDLRKGHLKSCGCFTGKFHATHDGSNSRLYGVCGDMKSRCLNNSFDAYKNYGGRGVSICNEWMDFANFRKWAMENGYDEYAQKGACTIDRIDVNGDYCPDNCRWVPMYEQSKNKRTNVFLELDGETHTLSEWGQITGIDQRTIGNRIRRGWSVEDALTVRPNGKRTQSTREAAHDSG